MSGARESTPLRVAYGRGAAALVKRLLASTVLAALALLGGAPLPGAQAAAPTLTITSPAASSISNDQTPSFSGTTTEEGVFSEDDPVTVSIYAGEAAAGTALQTLVTDETPTWSVGPAMPLAPGTYTAVSEQAEPCYSYPPQESCASGRSAPVIFTIDTTAPPVTLSSPSEGSQTTGDSQMVGGNAGTAPGDLPTITVQLFAGSTVGTQPPLETLTVQAAAGVWLATFGELSVGSYTVRAEQGDEAGNVGVSAPVAFTVAPSAPPPPPSAPTASVSWFPTMPQVGEPVTLVSSSTDPMSPITAFAWASPATAPFSVGRSVLHTSFATVGAHTVRLQVTAADGLSSVASATIRVLAPLVAVMHPFPIVRIAGALSSRGVVLSVLEAQAPVGAHVTVSCHGHGCPSGSASRVAASSSSRGGAASTVMIGFPRFERSLPAGVILEVKVFKAGAIGKYTRFRIRHGKLPTRLDACVDPQGAKAIACPS